MKKMFLAPLFLLVGLMSVTIAGLNASEITTPSDITVDVDNNTTEE
jgi:hypothetical protein